jgi:hypothetical protein
MKLLLSIMLAAFAPWTSAQTPEPTPFIPEEIARIIQIDHPEGQVPLAVIEVTGDKAINGVVLVLVDADPWPLTANFQRSSFLFAFPDDETAHGKLKRIYAWPNSTLANTRIGAVIFSDGTSLGSHRNPRTGKDVVQEIFDGREAAAIELSHWNSLLASLPVDPHTRLRAFAEALKEVTGGDETPSETVYQMDEHNGGSVLLALRIMLKRFEAIADEKVACSNLQSWLEKWTQSAIKSAKRAPQ